MSKIKIDYNGFLNSSGYSQAAQNYISALNKTNLYDIRFSLFGNKPNRPAVSDNKYSFFMELCRKKFNNDNSILQIYHCIPPLQKRIKKLQKNIGFGIFETFDVPENWIEILNQNDAVIVPSLFNYKIFGHSKLNKPLYHIPHCLDMDLYNDKVLPSQKFDKFTFLFMGTWKKRKGIFLLIEAWCNEFTEEDDNVQLIIKTDKPKIAEGYIERYIKKINKKGIAPIIVENKILSEEEIPAFLRTHNCLVSPSMGEGFGLPPIQCMALKIPIIVTDFSGVQDYATESTANLIQNEGFVQLADMDGIPQFKRKKWAFITVKSIQQKMRYVLENQEEVKKKAINGYDFVHKNFNYTVIANKFSDMIKEVYGS